MNITLEKEKGIVLKIELQGLEKQGTKVADLLLNSYNKVAIYKDSAYVVRYYDTLKNIKKIKLQETEKVNNILNDFLESLDIPKQTFSTSIPNQQKIEVESSLSFENESLGLNTFVEVKEEKTSLLNKIGEAIEEIFQLGMPVIITYKDVYKLSPLRTLYKDEPIKGMNYLQMLLDVSSVDVQSIHNEWQKLKPQTLQEAEIYFISFLNKFIKNPISFKKDSEFIAGEIWFKENMSPVFDYVYKEFFILVYKDTVEEEIIKVDINKLSVVLTVKALMMKSNIKLSVEEIKTILVNKLNYKTESIIKNQIEKNNLIWDGVDRFKEVQNVMRLDEVNTIRFSDYFKRWYVGMVKKFFDQKSKISLNPFVLVFISRQGGEGKSALASHLLPDSLFPIESCKGFKSEQGKDIDLQNDVKTTNSFNNKMLVGLGEFQITNAQINSGFKEMVGASTYSFKPLYGELSDRRQTFSFIATTNYMECIYSVEGCRRYMIIEFDSYDYKGYLSIDKEQLFLQALHEADNNWASYLYTPEFGEAVQEVAKAYTLHTTTAEIANQYFKQTTLAKLSILDIFEILDNKLVRYNRGDLKQELARYKKKTKLNGTFYYYLEVILT
jgi:hypothetical protein